MPENNISEEKIREVVEDVVAQEMKSSGQHNPKIKINPLYQKVAIDCTNAHNVSLQTLHYCESLGGKFADAESLNVLEDCADICGLMEDLLIRQSDLAPALVPVCIRACEACIKLAELLPEDSQLRALLEYSKVASLSLKKIK